ATPRRRAARPWALAAAALLGLCALLGHAPAAHAGGDVDPEAYRIYDVGDGKLSLDVADAPFGQVVRERIQPRTQVNIVVAPEAEAQLVRLRVTNLDWLLVLDLLTRSIGGTLVRTSPTLLQVQRPTPVTIDFTNADAVEVIQSIAKFGDASIVISEKFSGRITVSLRNLPWRAALERVVSVLRYALVEDDYGSLSVVPVDHLEKEEDYYRFRYLRPHAPYKGVIAPQSGGGGGGSDGAQQAANVVRSNVYVPSDDPKDAEDNFPIIAGLRSIVQPEGDIKYMSDQNAVLYTGIKTKIKRLKSMVSALDIEPAQIFVDMSFVITSNQDALNIGLNPGDTEGFGMGLSGSDFFHMMPWSLGGASDVASLLTGTRYNQPDASTFTYGRLGTSETSLLWKFLQRDVSTKVVQAPKLLALDNQEATVFVGETIRYARSDAATNQNGGLEVSVSEDENSPVNVGFQLLVLPHVIPGENKIMLTVIPQRRALSGKTSPLPGFDRLSVSGNFIDLPRVSSSTLVTHMILRSGETAVIGGLLEDREVDGVDKVPLLGDLPLLGLIFQGKEKTTVREHLLITVTPKLLRGTDAANAAITDELLGRRETVSAEYADVSGKAVQAHPLVTGEAPAGAEAPVPAQPAPAAEPLPVAPGR
ncbi:MAG: type II secretion system protein GspD, partial [Planctomycetia bacterium]